MYRMLWALELFIFLSRITEISSTNCPEDPGCSECNNSSGKGYEVYCGASLTTDASFRVEYKPWNEYLKRYFVRITCLSQPDWSDFHLGDKTKLEHVAEVILNNCNLPENALETVVNKLAGHDPVSSLQPHSDNNSRSDSNFPELVKLKIQNNQRLIIDSNIFTNLRNLQILNVTGNEIEKIMPQSFDNLHELHSLDLSLNNLKNLPLAIFDELENLKNLNLSMNDFLDNSLPKTLLERNVKLEILNFSYNRRNLSTLPRKWLTNLKSLTVLVLEKNGFIHLPDDLWLNATNLTLLTLASNYLTTLPKNIFKFCKNLETLNLQNNHLKQLPNGIFSPLKRLENLNLSLNQIKTISNDFFGGLNLKSLDMSQNQVDFIDKNAFRNTKTLEFINFSNNKLTINEISMLNNQRLLSSPFNYSKNSLRELYLSNNNISYIYWDWMFAPRLKVLDLQHNQLRGLHYNSLKFFSYENPLVDLRHNKIQTLNLSLMEEELKAYHYTGRLRLRVDNNPVDCDCSIYPFLRYREGRMHPAIRSIVVITIDHLRCTGPHELQNLAIEKLNSRTFQCRIPSKTTFDEMSCSKQCDCFIRPEDQEFFINCSQRKLRTVPAVLKAGKSPRIQLDLSRNYLPKMPATDGFENVTVLSVFENRISWISVEDLPENLTELYLHGNKLNKLDIGVINFFVNSKKLTNLTLHKNPWHCDCDTLSFLVFIQMKYSKFPELQRVICEFGEIPVFMMTRSDMCPPPIAMIAGISVGIGFIVVIMLFFILYYRYNVEIKVWLFARQWCTCFLNEVELDKDKIYDAFISYSHKDEDFVVTTLVPNLEQGPRAFKLCLHYRDWLAGEWIPAQISRSVADSRRTVVVVSKNFLESEWGKMEFRTAHCTALQEGRSRVIVIIYGDIGPIDEIESELQAYIKTNTYIKWGDRLFWQKLRYALPHPTDPVRMRKQYRVVLKNRNNDPMAQIIDGDDESLQ